MATQTSPRNQAVVPTTAAQILSCKDPQFRIYEIPVQIVWLVGVIRKLEFNFLEVSCEIQDNTGVIKGVMHLETESEVASKVGSIKQNSYAKIFGTVSQENGVKIILMMKAVPVDDANVITNHILQATCFALEAKAARNKQLASANTSGTALANAVVVSEDSEDETMTEPQFSDFQRLVFNIVKSECSEVGITKRNILKQFPLYQNYDVNQALQYLINEGIIYYSIDQEHLKVAES